MRQYFLFSNLLFLLFLACPHTALAKKKYRYIKREHGVRFQWDNPIVYHPQSLMAVADIKGAYTYNWMGMVEFGPYVTFHSDLNPFNLNEVSGGVLAEYNIIKNRGKRKFIPAIGLNLGVQRGSTVAGASSETNLSGGVHGALKIFVDKRTPFTIMIGGKMLTPADSPFQAGRYIWDIDVSMGFSYYFDFY